MMLVLSFVYPCNALCPHCPYTNSNIRKEYRDAPYMPEATFKRIADESGRYGAYLRISGGGEPMLHPQATELLVYAKNVGCQIGLITNGSLFDEANSRALLDAGVDMIEFSVDACDPADLCGGPQGARMGHSGRRREAHAVAAHALQAHLEDRRLGGRSRLASTSTPSKNTGSKGSVIDYLIKRKFLTWGDNTTLDASRSADPAAYLNTDEMPCPFIFERLNIDSRGNVMVCGYDIPATLAWVMSIPSRSVTSGMENGYRFYREKHLSRPWQRYRAVQGCPDWKYRSWKHNYWKVVPNAEEARERKLSRLGEHEDLGTVEGG